MAEKGRMTAVELVDKLMGGEHADVVGESVAWLVAEVMEAEVSGQIGAGLGEVSSERDVAQWLPGARVGDACGRVGVANPKAAFGELFPELSGAAPPR